MVAFLFWVEVTAQLRNLHSNVRDTQSACGTAPRKDVIIGKTTQIHIK